MRIKKLKLALISWPLLFVFSCLTINIYFPEAAVQKTAEEIASSQRSRIQKIFARLWIQDAHSGWWIQEESGEWIKKK